MTHVLHRLTRRIEASLNNRRTSRRMEAVLRDPHLAKDIGLPPIIPKHRKPDQW